MKKTQIGLTQVTAQVSGSALLDYAGRLGLAGVEPMIGQADSEYLSWTDGQIAQFLQHAKRLGLVVPTVALGAFNEDDALVSAAGRERAIDLITRCLDFSHSLGATVMLLCTFFKSHPDTAEKEAALIRVLEDVGPIARELGVTVALESPLNAQKLTEVITEADVIAEAQDQSIGVYYDVGNSLYLGHDVVAEILALGSLIKAMHIKDTATMLGDSHLGHGRLDLDAAVAALAQIGYKGWLMLETPSGNEPALRKDIEVLKRCLAGATRA